MFAIARTSSFTLVLYGDLLAFENLQGLYRQLGFLVCYISEAAKGVSFVEEKEIIVGEEAGSQ